MAEAAEDVNPPPSSADILNAPAERSCALDKSDEIGKILYGTLFYETCPSDSIM